MEKCQHKRSCLVCGFDYHRFGDLVDAARLLQSLNKKAELFTLDRINELVQARMIPHFRIDDGPPLFQLSAVKKFVAENLVEGFHAYKMPRELTVVQMGGGSVAATTQPLPSSLEGLREHIFDVATFSGVYFLIDDDDSSVVYIGQSTSVAARVGAHYDKDWDRAVAMPVPLSRLDAVEGALIRHFQPKYNQSAGPRPSGYTDEGTLGLVFQGQMPEPPKSEVFEYIDPEGALQ